MTGLKTQYLSRLYLVNMYDLNGKFIKQFRNIKTAKRETGCKSITQCCSEKYKKYTQSG